jgi:hypothetical protein
MDLPQLGLLPERLDVPIVIEELQHRLLIHTHDGIVYWRGLGLSILFI